MAKSRPIREIVAENVGRLMGYDRETGESKTPQDFLAGKGPSQSSIGRILRAEVDPRVDTVALIASHFGFKPWQLLVEDMRPEAPPLLKIPTGREAEFYRRVQELAKELKLDDEGTSGET